MKIIIAHVGSIPVMVSRAPPATRENFQPSTSGCSTIAGGALSARSGDGLLIYLAIAALRAMEFALRRRRSLGFSYVAARRIWSLRRSLSHAFLKRLINAGAASPTLAFTAIAINGSITHAAPGRHPVQVSSPVHL